MREFLEAQYAVTVLRWDEPTEDGTVFEALHGGRLLRADSLALFISEIQTRARAPLVLAWAA